MAMTPTPKVAWVSEKMPPSTTKMPRTTRKMLIFSPVATAPHLFDGVRRHMRLEHYSWRTEKI